MVFPQFHDTNFFKRLSWSRSRLFIRAAVNISVTGYALALWGLLLLRLVGLDHRSWIACLINFMPLYFIPLLGFIAVALLVRAQLALLAAVPLGVIGFILYAPFFLTKPIASASGIPLTFITFNVSDRNQQHDQVIAWLRAQDTDVVQLQEVTTAWLHPLIQQVKDIYPYQIDQPTEQGYRSNLTLSRYPVTLNPIPPNDKRLFHPMTLTVDGHSITLYNVSMPTPLTSPRQSDLPFEFSLFDFVLRYDDRHRNVQILKILAQAESETSPYIITGDFNMSDQTSIYGSLASQMGDSFREVGFGFGGTWPAFQLVGLSPRLPPLIRIDYVWHSQAFHAENARVGPYLGSDHLPVEAALSFVP